ncbi:MAG: aldolase/citrate lyase family protein, partial [Limnobacter sp.]|nr:aldolase/citrate lyase family protein [Limnobacter sp.]
MKNNLDLEEISSILFSEECAPVQLPVCDHYAGNPKFFEKALQVRGEIGACFDITIDLEDGAKVGSETDFVVWAAQALNDFRSRYGAETRRPGVRLHPGSHSLFEFEARTLLQAKVACPAYLMLPKPQNAQDVANAIQTMKALCEKEQVPCPPIHVLIETHGALAQVQDIAALPEVESLCFCLMDFISSHRSAIPKAALNSPGQFDNPLVRRAKLEISAACHRFGKVPSHNVTRNVVEPEIAGEDAMKAKKEFGYTRMWSIHPDQITHIVSAMLPTHNEVQEATAVLSEAQKAN